MSSKKNKSLLEFTTDEPNQSTNTTGTSDESTEPKGDHTEEDDGAVHICDCYAEERDSERWHELREQYSISDPKCGHSLAYLKDEIGSKIAPGTGYAYASKQKYFVIHLREEGKRVVDSELEDIDRFFKGLAIMDYTKNTLKSYKSAIVNLIKYIDIYRDAEPNADWAIIREEINPSEYKTGEGFEREGLEKWEVEALFDVMDFKEEMMTRVGIALGPRNVDIRKIKIQDVDLSENEIYLNDTKSSESYSRPITNTLSLLLQRWINVDRKQVPNSSETDYLFTNGRGDKLSAERFIEIVRERAWEAGIQEVIAKVPLRESQKEILGTENDYRKIHRVTVHTLRHTFNNLLKDGGLSLKDRSKALNHKQTETTEKHYDDEDTDFKDDVRDIISDADF